MSKIFENEILTFSTFQGHNIHFLSSIWLKLHILWEIKLKSKINKNSIELMFLFKMEIKIWKFYC